MAVLTKYDKGKTVTYPFSNYTVVMFVQGYVTVFLCLYELGRKGCHKATTFNCVPLRIGRGGCICSGAHRALLAFV